MAYTKTLSDANTYYGATNHIKSYDWLNYSENERSASLAQAQRQIELYLQRDAVDPQSGDRWRDDYAIFEQAIFLLEETVRTRQSTNSAQIIETVDSEQRDYYMGVIVCPAAREYLAVKKVRVING